VWKYGADDVRNILERASARETAARVAGGTVARAFLRALGVEVRSRVVQIGPVTVPALEAPLAVEDFEGIDDDPVRCLDAETSRAMVKHITVQRKANESIGGAYEVQVFGLVPGLGSHTAWEQRLGGRLAAAICSIQAHKGVEFGDGFGLAASPGSQSHDEIFNSEAEGIHRITNHSGGLEGGMTTGQPLVLRAAVKPIPTLTKPLRSIDLDTGEPAQALRERTDSCVVPAAGVVGEAMVALILADAYRQKFGGDHIDDVKLAVDAYRERIGWQTAATTGG
jgi:chorismate synthase